MERLKDPSLKLHRVRGYQVKSEGKSEAKKNPPAYRSLDDRKQRLKEGKTPSPKTDAMDLEQLGFAEMFEEGMKETQ